MTSDSAALYEQLAAKSKKIALLSGIDMLMSWDQEIYMPPKAIKYRGEQFELISGIIHKEKTSTGLGKVLGQLIDLESGEHLSTDLSERQKAAVREWRRDYLLAVKLPTSFVEKMAAAASASMHAWQEARKRNDFAFFLPHLKTIIDLCLEKADILGYDKHPYDALLDTFEPDLTTDLLSPLFEKLKLSLTNLLRQIQTKEPPSADFLSAVYPHNKQIAFGKKLLSAMGFSSDSSRLDESAHPMCMPLQPFDTRMTTRILPNQFFSNILTCIHEGGHGLYHANLPEKDFGTPLSEACSHGIDESQSRMWETIIGRSAPFWTHFLPNLSEIFPENLRDVRLEDFYRAINTVQPSFIRVESDEVTYNLHIMLRFEIEKGFMERKISAKDLPDIWREKMREYIGVCPERDSEGCLQDIHWSMGAIGYFPTYTLGNLYAAQFFHTLTNTFPDWKEQLEQGNLNFICDWTKENIHLKGREFRPMDLCKQVTGSPLSEEHLVNYLTNKYTSIYHL